MLVPRTRLQDSLAALRAAVAPAQLPLSLPGAEAQQRAVREMTAQLDDYILPRLETLDAPLPAFSGRNRAASDCRDRCHARAGHDAREP